MHYKKSIKIPIYRGRLILVATDDLSLCVKKYDYFDEDHEIFAHSILDNNGFENLYYLFTNPKHEMWDKRKIGVIAHESVHIASYIFNCVGAKYDIDNPEPFTYLVEWVANETYNFLTKLKD